MSKSRHAGLESLEEAIGLLRAAPPRAWAIYLSGAVPFFGSLLIFLAAATGTTEARNPLGQALILALLFGLFQFTKSQFAATLYRSLSGGVSGSGFGSGIHARVLAVTWFAGVIRLPMLVVPVSTVFAFFRNVTVLAATEEDPAAVFRKAARLAPRGGEQAPALLTMVVAAVVIWVNVFTGMLALPFVVRILTGQETIVTQNPGALANQTTVLASVFVTWCLLDVLAIAFYSLRVFYGRSESSGADLLRGWRTAALVLLCLLAPAKGAPQGSTAQVVLNAKDLNRALDTTLAKDAYRWREAPHVVNDNPVLRWIDNFFSTLRRSIKWIGHQIAEFIDWLFGLTPDPVAAGRGLATTLRAVSWIAIALFAGAVAALLMRRRARKANAVAPPLPLPTALDLADPLLLANQLPEEEWLALARDWFDKGDYRMALRAWFLANLAFLARRELVSIGRSRTNMDYLRELRRRARAFTGMDALFEANLRSFENAWYGLHDVERDAITSFADNFERIRALAREVERIRALAG